MIDISTSHTHTYTPEDYKLDKKCLYSSNNGLKMLKVQDKSRNPAKYEGYLKLCLSFKWSCHKKGTNLITISDPYLGTLTNQDIGVRHLYEI